MTAAKKTTASSPKRAAKTADTAAGLQIYDTYSNLVSGLGTAGNDKSVISGLAGGFQFSAAGLELLYKTDFMARQVVDVPADDATRPWRVWNADTGHASKLFAEEERLRVRDRVRQALKHARLFGGGALIIHDGTADMSKPFVAASVKKGGLKALVVASRSELTAVAANQFVTDPEDPHYGLPVLWNYQSKRFVQAGSKVVHHSRLVLIAQGDGIEDTLRPEWWWGEPVLQTMAQDIANASGARSAATHLMQEANIDVVRTAGLLNRMETAKGREVLIEAAHLMKTMKSNFNMLMLDKDQEYSRNAFSFSGIKDIVEVQHALVAAAADIPITRLLGRSPAGMNATGESDALNYFAMLGSIQTSTISPCMAALDEAIIRSALGSFPADVWYDWRKPDTLTEEQRVKHAETRAKTVKEYAATGLVPEAVMEASVRSLLVETGDLPGAEAAYLEWDEAGNEIDFKEEDPPEPPAIPPPGAPPVDPDAAPPVPPEPGA